MANENKAGNRWWTHLYRPEVLMLYIFGLIALYIAWDKGVEELEAVRLYPLADGSALAVGYKMDGENQKVVVWRTGAEQGIRWSTKLEDNWVIPVSRSLFRPLITSDNNLAYVITGIQVGKERQMASIHALDLEKGTLIWTATDQPSGDANFTAAYRLGDRLVTCHTRTKAPGSWYLAGRRLQDGEMVWRTIVKNERENKTPTFAFGLEQHLGIATGDSIEVIATKDGSRFIQLAASAHMFHGGYLFYEEARRSGWHILDPESGQDSLLGYFLPGRPMTSIAPPKTGAFASGFYNGFPVGTDGRYGWLDAESDTVSFSESGFRLPYLTFPHNIPSNRNHFLADEWPRFLPSFYETENQLTLSLFDLENMEQAFRSQAIPGQEAQLLTFGKYFYWLFQTNDNRNVVLQFNGEDGGIVKGVRSLAEIGLSGSVRPDQPTGARIWMGGDQNYIALDARNLETVYRSVDAPVFEEVTREYADLLGYRTN